MPIFVSCLFVGKFNSDTLELFVQIVFYRHQFSDRFKWNSLRWTIKLRAKNGISVISTFTPKPHLLVRRNIPRFTSIRDMPNKLGQAGQGVSASLPVAPQALAKAEARHAPRLLRREFKQRSPAVGHLVVGASLEGGSVKIVIGT